MVGENKTTFGRALLEWYDANQRELPWRENKDPYRVWVSEIMLQQTRVAAVIDYYQRFLSRFPDVRTLARAREETVLALWSGLGYYRRARALHAAAKVVVNERKGDFPKTAAELRELPGVGRYTAAAIASIAFDEACAVVDGNVERVLARVTGNAELGREETWKIAEELVSRERPGDFNQAMMELGATVCVPAEPLCLVCPISKLCATNGRGERREKQVRKQRALSYALIERHGAVYMVRRDTTASLMAGMWELPTVWEDGGEPVLRVRHSITDTDYRVNIFRGDGTEPSGGKWIDKNKLGKLAMTGLARKVLRKAGMLVESSKRSEAAAKRAARKIRTNPE